MSIFFLYCAQNTSSSKTERLACARLCSETSIRSCCCKTKVCNCRNTTTNPITSTPCDRLFNEPFERVSSNSECSPCFTNCDNGCVVEGLPACPFSCIGRTVFIPRSVGANTARELVGWQSDIHRFDAFGNYITIANATGYTKSFDPERIAQYLFGNTVLNFQGSQVPQRSACALLADYFGLPTTFSGTIHVNPIIENIFFDTQVFIGLDAVACGLYARFHIPLVHTRWNLHACPCSSMQDGSDFAACYMSSNATSSAQNLPEALGNNFTFGAVHTRRTYQALPFRELTCTKFADVDLIIGYDFWQCDQYYLGFYAQAVAPTGNRPDPRFVFSPVIGNAHHFELGAGIAGKLRLWDRGPDTSLSVYLEGNVTHMFESEQCRTFDLCNRLFSRYMLLKEFEADAVTPTGNLLYASDFTTRAVKTYVPAKGDVSAKLAYRTCSIDIDIGYNFYGHMAERLCLRTNTSSRNNMRVGLKGTEGTCFTAYNVTQQDMLGAPAGTFGLSSTQHNATAFTSGTTDNPHTPAQVNAGELPLAWNTPRNTGPASGNDLVIAYASQPPVLLTDRDLDLCSGTACPFATHKFFAYLGYTIPETYCGLFEGFIGVGGEVEFEALARDQRSSLNQWSIYAKGGITY